MNEEVTYKVLQQVIDQGTSEFVLCPGSRNSSFIEALRLDERLTTYYFPEERSAAFFALGRSRLKNAPVAVVTTSGTAAAELLPAAMEAHYSGVPLILITADRPSRFRGSGAPQSAEQVGLYSHFVKLCFDVDFNTTVALDHWDRRGPVHINVCLDEPQKQPAFQGRTLTVGGRKTAAPMQDWRQPKEVLSHFLEQVKRPIAIVSTLAPWCRESVVQLLLRLQMPVMLEGISGLRADPRLDALAIRGTDHVLEAAARNGYDVDGVLRIGGVPTHRIWRDLEYLGDKIRVCGLSELPFSGLSWNRRVAHGSINGIIDGYTPPGSFSNAGAGEWLLEEALFSQKLEALFLEERTAEASLIHALSGDIPDKAFVYLGNSLPMREWDLAAVRTDKHWDVGGNRGVNGIDGQISTFLGQCRPGVENWALLGDLTTLYDMAAGWIMPQLETGKIVLVVINNGGGMIFKRMYPHQEMLNEHSLSFRPLADMWGFDYHCSRIALGEAPAPSGKCLIELIPDPSATDRFWKKYAALEQEFARQGVRQSGSVK